MKKTNHLKDPKAPWRNKSLKNLKGEEWKEIPFTEGYYLISNFGRVKALARFIEQYSNGKGRWMKERILNQHLIKSKNNYKNDYKFGLMVNYKFNRQEFRPMVRRLVYEAFVLPLIKEKMEGRYVYPKNGDGLNSYADNLGLATKSELRKMQLTDDRYIPPAFKVDQEANRRHLLRMNRKKRLPVKQYRLDGKLIRKYKSISEAAFKTGIRVGNISACAMGKCVQTSGFVWRLNGDSYKGEHRHWTGKRREVIQYSIGGKKLKQYISISEAARQSRIHQGNIFNALKRKSKQAGGFVWRYVGETYNGEYKKLYRYHTVIQYNLQRKKIATFKSISAAAKATNSSYEGIRLAVQQKTKTSNGFKWKYAKSLAETLSYNITKS